MSNISHGADFQRQVLHLMITEPKFCAKASEYLQEAFFSAELKWFFRTVRDLYLEHKMPPKLSTLTSECHMHGLEAQKYLEQLNLIYTSNPQEDYVKRELTSFIKANMFVLAAKEAVNLYNSGSREQSYDFTREQLDKLIKVDFEKERTANFGTVFDDLEVARKQHTGAIPTGIIGIDQAMNGGLFPQTWTTFLGGSNSGKSMLMPSLAYHAYRAGKKTFVTIHEDEEVPTKMRYYSRFTGIPFSRLFAPDLTDEERDLLKMADGVLKDHVRLRFMYLQESTVEAVQTAARNLHRDWPFDLFLCDYGQCLTTNRFKTIDNTRLLQEYVYHELKQLCLELNVAGAGGAQVNRAGHAMAKTGADLLRMTDVGESWGIVKKSSNVITMNRSDEDATHNRIIFLLDKVRNGTCPVAVECATDYGRCMTHDADNPSTQRLMEISLRASKEPEGE
jgi:KaiC/GvpD/RAD55 family RecA-like ATPase